YVTEEDFAATGAERTDTEDAINTLLSVAGAEIAIMFVAIAEDLTKVSLRSRSQFDVRAVAEQFGGGGHRAAAGVSYAGSMAQAQGRILDAIRAAMEDSKS
ncbi:MAG: DHHA1 domain-containing protein, partial [Planctomycetota bacterium]